MSQPLQASYRVAVIGCGGRGREHAPALQADPRVRVVALADVKRENAETLNADFGFGAAIYADHKEMLAAEKPDVVVVTLWTTLHLPVFRDCVAAGVKAVLSEKPMAPTWGECLEMRRLAEGSGCQLTFSHQRRFAAGNQLARRLIAEGTFGAILRMDLTAPPNLLDCGTHTFDQALSFLGDAVGVKWALGAVDTTETLDWFGVKAEGMAQGTLVFENGVRAALQIGPPDLDFWGGVRVHGQEGFLEVTWDGAFTRAVVYADPSWQPPTVEDAPGAHMLGYVRNALDCLASGAEPETSYYKALRATEIIFALYESVRRHKRVPLPLTGVTDNPFLTMLAAGEFETPGA